MPNRYISFFFGISTVAAATIAPSVPAHGMSMACETGDLFNFDSIQFLKVRPIHSHNCLRLFGDRSGASDPDPQGLVAYTQGHLETSPGAPDNSFAPYYVAGMDFSPENLVAPIGATRATTLLPEITGFSNFTSFLVNNSIDVDRIGFSFGPRDGDFTKTWNLGDDINGQNYFSSSTSSLEERIYAANPDEVESFLLLDDTKILTFGYTNIYSFLDYGATTAPDDDVDAVLSDPFTVAKISGLSGEFDGLADAFLADVGKSRVQLVSEDAGVVPDFVFFDPSIGALNPVISIPLPMQLRIVSVPEPTVTLGLLSLGLMAAGSHFKNKNRSRH